VLCGIGFTMSLFIGSLAFENDGSMEYVVDDRLGILVGSFLSAVVGAVLVYRTCPLPAAGQKG
jgi:Na+:H+ antiporter, NhaA family